MLYQLVRLIFTISMCRAVQQISSYRTTQNKVVLAYTDLYQLVFGILVKNEISSKKFFMQNPRLLLSFLAQNPLSLSQYLASLYQVPHLSRAKILPTSLQAPCQNIFHAKFSLPSLFSHAKSSLSLSQSLASLSSPPSPPLSKILTYLSVSSLSASSMPKNACSILKFASSIPKNMRWVLSVVYCLGLQDREITFFLSLLLWPNRLFSF